MNREQKRAAQKAGQVNADGSPIAVRDRRAASAQRLNSERTKPMQFVREVRAEMRKVSWPTRDEVIRYSIIVFVSLTIFTLFVFGCDYLFERLFRFIAFPAQEGSSGALLAPGALRHAAALAVGSY